MTRAPRSVSCRVANGAATACSRETTVTPSSGCRMLTVLSECGFLGSRGNAVALDQLPGDHVALNLIGALADDHQRRVPEIALDVELRGVAVAAVDADGVQ